MRIRCLRRKQSQPQGLGWHAVRRTHGTYSLMRCVYVRNATNEIESEADVGCMQLQSTVLNVTAARPPYEQAHHIQIPFSSYARYPSISYRHRLQQQPSKNIAKCLSTNPKFWVWKIKYLHWFWNCIVEFIVICSALLMIKIFGMIMNFIFFSSLVTRHVAEAVDTRSSRIYSSAAAAKEDSAVVEERPTHLSCSRNTRWTKKKLEKFYLGSTMHESETAEGFCVTATATSYTHIRRAL